jgi:hypothetical protein
VSHSPKIAAALLAAVCAAGPASAGFFKGSYMVRYFSGPAHTQSSNICAFFKHTGAVDGFPDSGLWHAKTAEGVERGNYVVDQGVLRFYGNFSKGRIATNNYATLATAAGGFDIWDISSIPVTPEQDGTIQIAKGC